MTLLDSLTQAAIPFLPWLAAGFAGAAGVVMAVVARTSVDREESPWNN